jgi:hypothetical protein
MATTTVALPHSGLSLRYPTRGAVSLDKPGAAPSRFDNICGHPTIGSFRRLLPLSSAASDGVARRQECPGS